MNAAFILYSSTAWHRAVCIGHPRRIARLARPTIPIRCPMLCPIPVAISEAPCHLCKHTAGNQRAVDPNFAGEFHMSRGEKILANDTEIQILAYPPAEARVDPHVRGNAG